jgi:hypothetical protein
MSEKLITIATFANPVEANLAKNRLETAGIRAFLADEETVDMAWQLTGAVGGIKLQIPEGDEEVALSLLEKPMEAVERRATGRPRRKTRKVIKLTTAITVDGPRMVTERAEELEEDEEPVFGDDEDDEEEEEPSEIDQVAERAWRGALLGILFFPIQLYVFGLLIHVIFARERPSPRLWWKVGVAAVVNLSVLAFLFLFLTANNLTLKK